MLLRHGISDGITHSIVTKGQRGGFKNTKGQMPCMPCCNPVDRKNTDKRESCCIGKLIQDTYFIFV